MVVGCSGCNSTCVGALKNIGHRDTENTEVISVFVVYEFACNASLMQAYEYSERKYT